MGQKEQEDFEGKTKHATGKVKEGLGEFLGDKEMEREGKKNQIAGEAKQDAARAQEEYEQAKAKERLAEEN